MSRKSLNGRWELREDAPESRVDWIRASVPGCVHADLLKARIIPDPHVGRQEFDCFWVDQTDWQYRRTFKATAREAAAAMQQLVFEGLDTVAEVHLNGKRVGRADNMFRRWRFDVAGVLREGENELAVTFRSAIKEGQKLAKKSDSACRPLDADHWADHPPVPAYRPFVRKGQYQYGWDWGVMAVSCGIWKDCYLLATDEPVLDYVTTLQDHRDDGSVALEVTARVLAPSDGKGSLRVKVAGASAETGAKLRAGENVVKTTVEVANPQLWWPAGQGKQALYQMTADWLPASDEKAARAARPSDTCQARIGFRTVELVTDKDETGNRFAFRINGRDVYCKGANWIPDDVFPSRTTDARTTRLLEDTIAANMNMLRVWGGGVYVDDHFLETCDQMGIMVWHDFMFACAAYPGDQWFLDSVEAECRHQMRRMHNHPSIVLWCGNNELQQGLYGWWKTLPGHDKMVKAYLALTEGVQERVVGEEDPGRPWWPSSPSYGTARALEHNHGLQDKGDMHYWGVWHGGEPFEAFQKLNPRFCSEFGFQAFPSVETLLEVMDKDDLNVNSPVMEHHQRSLRRGNAAIVEFLFREFRFPADFDDFCYLSQVNQGLAIKMACEHWRRIKPHCMGTLYWQLNDDWAVASWASIDWYMRWKALHHMARRFYAPLLGSVIDGEKGLQLWGTSDLPERIDGSWKAEAWTAAGKRVWSDKGAFRLQAQQSRAIIRLPRQEILDAAGGEVGTFLLTEVRAGKHKSENMFQFAPLKRAELQKPNIRADIRRCGDGYTVKLTADAPAFHVELSTGKLLGHWSDNILTLVPRRTTTVTFVPEKPTTLATLKKNLKIRSVRDTY